MPYRLWQAEVGQLPVTRELFVGGCEKIVKRKLQVNPAAPLSRHDDLLVGAYGEDSGGDVAGAAYLLLGPATGEHALEQAAGRLTGERAGDMAGNAVSAAGDVDDDGHADLLVGAAAEGSNGAYAGTAYLVLGPVSGNRSLADADLRLRGDALGDQAGYSLAAAGDMNGDGQDDVLVGAPGSDQGGSDAGAAFLVLDW